MPSGLIKVYIQTENTRQTKLYQNQIHSTFQTQVIINQSYIH